MSTPQKDAEKKDDGPFRTTPSPSAEAPQQFFPELFSSLFYISIFIFIGVPLWWKTTTITRVPLPFAEINSLQQISGSPQQERSLVDKNAPLSERWKTFWNIPPMTAVDIVFTIVNPSPDKFTTHWNAQEDLHNYLDPVLSLLDPVANFTVSSQSLRYLDEPLITSFDATEQAHVITLREASKIINHIESRLGSFSSNNHVINFIIFVPSPQHRPLRLLGLDNKFIPTNSFITPRWGGALIYSPVSASNDNVKQDIVDVDAKEIVQIFLAQLFVHLGLYKADEVPPSLDIKNDISSLIAKRAVMNVDDSISTLKSLARLLDQMGHIAINDVVGQNIYDAVSHIHDAQSHLRTGESLLAMDASRKAWEKAERAFYDPSLLEQLYFPDDQKFAIYVPLFLPAALPVVLSIQSLSKWWKNRRIVKSS